jgi:WD40 repeat protein
MKVLATVLIPVLSLGMAQLAAEENSAVRPVSFYRDVRPIFQAHCQGCHQPAKASGSYVMTSVEQLFRAGESGEAAIVPGKPDESYLMQEITPNADGQAEMPKGKPALAKVEIDTIRRWIAEGATDDTPANAQVKYDLEHPPVYTRPPVITSLAYSPDGKLLAISGFHEVLIQRLQAEGDLPAGLAARLIGMSARIESVAFSPDGRRLAVAAGNPARLGELQIWNLFGEGTGADATPGTSLQPQLELAVGVGYDTLYGVSWSPDGKLVAVGAPDNTVRGFDSQTGEQVFFNGAHDDWPLDTVFSVDGSKLLSVGRDMATKLYDVGTQRFIDNVTSITPGALKGGISAVARHPERNEVVVGGSDGTPRIYRMERVTVRVIGDDANLIRRYPALPGRIYGVSFSPDGKVIACASSLDGRGFVRFFKAEYDPTMPDEIKGIVQKVVTSQSAEEKAKLEAYVTAGVEQLAAIELPHPVFALAYAPDGKSVAVAGPDGQVRLLNPADASVLQEFQPVEVSGEGMLTKADYNPAHAEAGDGVVEPEQLPSGSAVTGLSVVPQQIRLHGPHAYAQVLVLAQLNTGDIVDATRIAKLKLHGETAALNSRGRVTSLADGRAALEVSLGEHHAEVPIEITGSQSAGPVSFIRDVNPVLSRLGCNQGTCHGAKDGKEGFKLSLRGYDPIFDVRALTDDLKSRRVNVAAPDDSLMLLKATGAVPHVGGQLTTPGHPYYETIRRWIAEGAVLDLDAPRVESITIEPQDPVVQLIGARQQLRVVAHYTDGTERDVTGEAFIESGNTEAAEINRAAIVTAIRRGEAPLLARYEGRYAATTLTVMGNREGFVWQEPETWGRIDALVAQKWQRMKIEPAELCTDAEFIRRVYLDLTGLPPTADAVREFLADGTDQREKRNKLIDQLIGSDAYVDYWTNKWADLLQVNRKFLGPEGARTFRDWIRSHVAANTPYDQFSREIITATGSNKANPPASYYKILRDPADIMENTTHLFLAVRFNCNKCHDHPFERWTQDQYYETAAFFSRVGLQRDPENAAGDIGGTAVEGAKPLWEVVYEKPEGEITHDRTGAVTAPVVPYDRELPLPAEGSRREQLATWITSPQNDYFAKSYVNRIWGYLLGVGLIEPIDDIRAGNPPTNPELLDHLTEQFIESGFDVRELMRSICRSRTYQLAITTNPWNEDDQLNYSRARPKRLPAEVLYDTVYTVTGARTNIPGVPAGTRAAAIPDVGIELSDNFLANLGRPVRESACECERSNDLQLGPVMALMNGPTVSEAISQAGNAISQLVATQPDDAALVNELFLRILNRPATAAEVAAAKSLMGELQPMHAQLEAELAAYRAQIEPATRLKEAKREQAIATAQQAYDAHWASIRETVEAAEKARQEKIAAAQAALDGYAATLPEKIAAWEAAVSTGETAWTVLDPRQMKSNTGAKFEKEEGSIIFVTGPNNKKGNYTIVAETSVAGVTGLKLDLYADPRLPSNGPGRAPNGNFVLTELTVEAWPKGKPDEKQTLVLQNAKADFSQANFDVAGVIDGNKTASNNGWATHPETGKNRVATFELKEPLALTGEIVLQFTLDQMYDGRDHTIGRFRLSVTNAPTPLNFGLPQNVIEIARVPAADRTDEQRKALDDFYKQQDAEFQKLQKGLADAQQPLPEDARLVELRKVLEEVRQPLPVDPQLARLERAVQLSAEQLQNERLTAAQDLAWALINSPAFLFNR